MTTKPKTRTAPAVKRASYDAFVSKMLDPVPAAELVDIAYNQAIRKTRLDAWRAARAETEMFHSLAKYHWAESDYFKYRKGDPERERLSINRSWAYSETCRDATCRQMRTPAPDPAAVAWKKQRAEYAAFTMPREEIDELIAADEAFLAAHPVSARKKAA